ncbi:MAG: flagellar filament capping protein FliD [Steroidobacteraceae bacterium]
MIRSPGITSGLDVNAIVEQLVAAERAPVATRLDQQKADAEATISALGKLKGVLGALQSIAKKFDSIENFTPFTAVSGNENIFTAIAAPTVSAGSYAIEVTQIAAAQKLASGSFAGGAPAVVGTGNLQLSLGSKTFQVTIDQGNSTLQGIRDAINSATDNPGIAATIVNTTAGARLIFTSTVTGAANTISIVPSGGDGGLAALEHNPPGGQSLTEIQGAQDALLKVDGFDVQSSGNALDDVIDGVTINLTNADPGTTYALDIAADKKAVVDQIKNFATTLSAVFLTSAQLRSFDPDTKAAGPLLGDSMLRGLELQLRRTMTSELSTNPQALSSLSAIGITTNADGSIAVDDAKLQSAVDAGFDSVAALFAGENGIGAQMLTQLDAILGSDAPIDVRTKALQSKQRRLDAAYEQLDRRMQAVETTYRAQFTALDTLLAGLQSTSAFLTQQLASLPTTRN